MGRALDGSRRVGGKLTMTSQTSDPDEAMKVLARLGEAVRESPKDFK